MTREEFVMWMEAEDNDVRSHDWSYYFYRGVMELLVPLLEARGGAEMAGYLRAMGDYVELRNWTSYENGRRLGEALVAGEIAVDRETAEVSLEGIMVDPPVPEELTALRDRVLAKEQEIYFELYQHMASEAWKFQGIHAALCGIRAGGVDMEWLGKMFGRQEEEED